MKCRLCLSEGQGYFSIFRNEGQHRRIAEMISKFFWFEVYEDDPISSHICESCWNHLDSFHKFYLEVERKLTNVFKDEKCQVFLELPILEDEFKVKSEVDEAECTKVDPAIPALAEQESPVESIKLESEKIKAIANSLPALKKLRKRGPRKNWDLDLDVKVELSDDDEKCDERGRKKRSMRCVVKKKLEAAEPVYCEADVEDMLLLPSSTYVKNESNYECSEETDSNDSDASQRSRDRPKRKVRTDGCRRRRPPQSGPCELEKLLENYCSMNCERCGKPFEEKTWNGITDHYNEKHRMRGFLQCCNKRFEAKNRMLDHIRVHLNPVEFQCTVCQKNMDSRYHLLRHIENHKKAAEKKKVDRVVKLRPFKCKRCPKRFDEEHERDSHMTAAHPPQKKTNEKCPQCDKVLSSAVTLRAHIRNVHEQRQTHICEICAKTFKTKLNYEQHKGRVHDSDENPSVQCPICNNWSKNKFCLRLHMRHHTDGPVECDVCGKISPNRSALRGHKKYVHLLQRVHQCHFCEKAFKQNVELVEHEATHTGIVLYRCSAPDCSKSSNSHANLAAHMKKDHREFWLKEKRQKYLPQTSAS